MTIYDIENYLLKVGASKYRQKNIQEEFKDFSPISRFGIGILTCFMVADDIDIETNPNTDDEVNIICIRNVNGNYLLKKEEKSRASDYIKEHGTIITLHIRQDVDMSNLESNLRKWIINPEVNVKLSIDDKDPMKIGSSSLSDILKEYLEEEGYKVDGTDIKIEEKHIGGVTVACALQYNKYLSDWSFIRFHENNNKDNIPMGTCIEGIRVEFTTPGYNAKNFLAIANIKGSKYQTNVARTALEYDANNEVLKSIYECYKAFIEDQVIALENAHFSKSWALNESYYLMSPLVGNKYHYCGDNPNPVDNDLLLECLAKIKCLFVENNGKRDILSAIDMRSIQRFDIVHSNIVNAIESLLKEIPCNATATEIMDSVCPGHNIYNVEVPTISNYNEYNILHRYATDDKQVSEITVDTINRIIRLSFTQGDDIWNKYTISNGRYNYIVLYIPQKEFSIKGLDNEVGVRTIGGIYLNSESELCYYIKNIIKIFEEDHSKENKMLMQLFLSNIFTSRFLEVAVKKDDASYIVRNMLKDSNISINSSLVEKMWKKINSAEFSEIVLTKNHSLFSLNNWSRTYTSSYSDDYMDF